MYPQYTLGPAMKLFFLPGNLVADALGITKTDDRTMVRTMIDMLFWNIVIIVGAFVIFV